MEGSGPMAIAWFTKHLGFACQPRKRKSRGIRSRLDFEELEARVTPNQTCVPGVGDDAQLFVSNTKLLDNSGGGVLIKPSGAATAALDHVDAEANQFGVKVQDNAQVSISNSLASGNTQNGMQTLTTSAAAHVDLVND